MLFAGDYELQYLRACQHILKNGFPEQGRAKLRSTGKNPTVYSVFDGLQLKFDLKSGFPLLTTKRIPWRLIVHELLWFISGSTNVKDLQKHGVHIWDAWANSEGELGPVYGQHWRAYAGPNGPVDQFAELVNGIDHTIKYPHAPEARRLMLMSYHPANKPDVSVPMGCHTSAQFKVQNKHLYCHVYQRSADMFLGLPFNVPLYAILLQLLAKWFGLDLGNLIFSIGDAHIYENHVDQLQSQFKRTRYQLPRLKVNYFQDIFYVPAEDISVESYECGEPLFGEVAV